jgi:multiple sugar transport system substrate-binding protein
VAVECERELTRGGLLRAGAAFAVAGPHRFTKRQLRHELRILQWAHPTPGYDAWLGRRAASWGEAHDARVTIDHVNPGELAIRARAEIATRSGHDLVQFLVPPTAFQLDAAPLDDAVAEVTRRLGRASRVASGSAYNPRTRRWFAFPDHFVPLHAIRRTDLIADAPATWDDVLRIAPDLRRRGHPVAIGLAGELDSNAANLSLLLAHGGRMTALGAPATAVYLRAIAELYRSGLPREVVDWHPASNNQFLGAGRGSLIVNPLTALRGSRLPLAASPLPAHAVPHTTGCYVLWRFSPNRALAERFLVDQQLAYREHFARSGSLNVPAWPGAVPELARIAPEVAAAAARTVNAGWPGPTNGAVQELSESFVVPTMARRVAQGRATAEDAAAQAGEQARAVFAKWREAKLI